VREDCLKDDNLLCFVVVCVVFDNSQVEAEGIGLGGIILQDMKTIRVMVAPGAVVVAAVTVAILLPGTFGLGIYHTIL
jgi:hypothetical protein